MKLIEIIPSNIGRGENPEPLPIRQAIGDTGSFDIERIERASELTLVLNPSGIGDLMVFSFLIAGALQKYPRKKLILSIAKNLVRWSKLIEGPHEVIINNHHFENGKKRVRTYLAGMTRYNVVCAKRTRHDLFSSLAKVPCVRPSIKRTKMPSCDVLLCPQSNQAMREWGMNNFAALSKLLIAQGVKVACAWHGDSDGPKIAGILNCDVHTQCEPEELVGLIAAARLTIGNDSGSVHIAGTINAPALAIVAKENAVGVFGGYNSVEWIQSEVWCSPCLGEPDFGYGPECEKHCRALRLISPEEVFERAMKMLKSCAVRMALDSASSKIPNLIA